MRLVAMICAAVLAVGPVAAQETETLGVGRLFTNDVFGDLDDRWRTTSYVYSIVRGSEWDGRPPAMPGAILEYRLRSEIIAPSNLTGAGSDDRAYVGALSAGVHTYFSRGGADISAGVDLVALGPQTGVAGAQDWFHNLIGAPVPSQFVVDNQVANAVYPTALAALSYPVQINPSTQVRPFVEAQYGVEDVFRVGADVIIGNIGQSDLWLRDVTTGQLYRGISDTLTGQSFVLGADYAVVGDSAYFPESFGTVATEDRLRVRAGYHWQFYEDGSFFYGVTYLSEEFEGQPEGQIVGSLKLNFNF